MMRPPCHALLRHLLTATVLSLTIPLASAAGQAAAYTLTDLGTLPGGDLSRATAISPQGVVVGQSSAEPQTYQMHPVSFTADAPHRLLQGTGRVSAVGSATAIDAQGRVAGTLSLRRPTAYLLEDGTLTLLRPAQGWAEALAMNQRRELVGQGMVERDFLGGWLWRAGTWTALHGPVAGLRTAALGLNDQGLAVGWADLKTGRHARRVAYLWQDGVAVGALPGLGGRWSEARAINASGTVVGHSALSDRYDRHAFVYQDGRLSDIDGDPLSTSEAWAVNAGGEVVGWRSRGGPQQAFLYRNGHLRALDALLSDEQRAEWQVDLAHAISDDGHIVGEALHRGVGRRAVLLTPAGTR